MQCIEIKMIYCQTRASETRIVEYSHDSTIRDVANKAYPELNEKLICDISTKRIQDVVDFYLKDGVFRWGVDPYSIYVDDYLNRFPACRTEGLLFYTDIGGFGGPIDGFIDLWRELELFVSNNPVLSGMMLYGLKKAWDSLQKWLNNHRRCISLNALRNACHSQEIWTLEQAENAFEMDQDSLIIVMECMGYQYNQEKQVFYEKK